MRPLEPEMRGPGWRKDGEPPHEVGHLVRYALLATIALACSRPSGTTRSEPIADAATREPLAASASADPTVVRIDMQDLSPMGPTLSVDDMVRRGLALAHDRFGIEEPVLVLLTAGCVLPRGLMDMRRDAPCPGGIAGTVTGRTRRSDDILLGVGAEGMILRRFPGEHARATHVRCALARVLERARHEIGGADPLTVRYAPDLTSIPGGGRGVWNVHASPRGDEKTIDDVACAETSP